MFENIELLTVLTTRNKDMSIVYGQGDATLDRRDQGGRAAAGHLYVLYIHRSLNLDPKIFELFIQLLKCYRLLGNIRIDLGFELNGFPSRRPMRGQYPGHVTKGAGEKNISEFRT